MRKAYQMGWITTRDGNISVKKNNKFYITPSGVRKYIIHPEHIIKGYYKELVLEMPDDANVSGEFEMHKQLQFKTGSCAAVVHLHPTYILAAMEKGWDLQVLATRFPEVSRYTNVGPATEIHEVCSEGLAQDTLKQFTDDDPLNGIIYDIIGQPRHGVTAIAKTPWDAYEHIERLEHICKIAVLSGIYPHDVDFKS